MTSDQTPTQDPKDLVAAAVDCCRQIETVLRTTVTQGIDSAQRETLLAGAEPVLDELQLAVNRQAQQGNLGMMRELSRERNALLEAIRKLKKVPELGAIPPPQSRPTKSTDELKADKAFAKKKRTMAAKQLEARAAIFAEVEARQAKRRRLWRWTVFSILVVASVALAIFKGAVVNRELDPREATNNHAPEIVTLSIDETPYGVQAKVKVDDAEGDHTRLNVQWFVNGRLVVGANGLQLQRRAYDGGEKIHLVVTAEDAIGPGTPRRSPSITVSGAIRQQVGSF